MLPAKPLISIYNPLNQTEAELLDNFVVREKEFRRIFNSIKQSSQKYPEHHFIIQGQRGQGKTTLLLKLFYEIKRDKTLASAIVPIVFNEEQYHLNSLPSLWLSVAEYLDDIEPFAGIHEQMETVHQYQDSEAEAFQVLENALKQQKKKIILLIDNIGQLLGKLAKREQQRLREILIACPYIRLIGASAVVLEYIYDYNKPFYELFTTIDLKGLSKKEAITLLLKLGQHPKHEHIKKIVFNEPGRVEALRRLTGGVPRSIILMSEIFVKSEDGSAFQDLEYILDRLTSPYKHRMDDLSPQQQRIVDTVALNWDAITTGEIAEKTRMQSKAISAQLKQLEKNRIIRKIKTGTKNHLYQITERLFNIWYMMRCGRRRGRNRVRWLVRFLESWCSEQDLTQRSDQATDTLPYGSVHSRQVQYTIDTLANENEIKTTIQTINEYLNHEGFIEKNIRPTSRLLILLLAKGQYYATLRMFKENLFDLKERFKPTYYAMMYFLQDEYPDEYKKMGDELKETVEEVIDRVKNWEKD